MLLLRIIPSSASRQLCLKSCRALSCTPHLRTATPDWQTMIGGREAIETKRKAFEEKYQTAIAKAAKKEGMTVERLKAAKAHQTKLAEDKKREEKAEVLRKLREVDEIKSGKEVGSTEKEIKTKQEKKATDGSPVKSLQSILDLSKASTLTSPEISALWTTYHQSKGFLSAAIPTDTYTRMMGVAKKYPIFVLPLARDIIGDTPKDLPAADGAVEMHLLEWAFLPQPADVLEPVPAPSTVLFTPLAEYQSRQSFAQPYLILTHYTDLSLSHNVVLMRGEVSDNVALNATDAQVLAVRLQLFYNYTGVGGKREADRLELLTNFHETPEKFDLEKLVKTAYEL